MEGGIWVKRLKGKVIIFVILISSIISMPTMAKGTCTHNYSQIGVMIVGNYVTTHYVCGKYGAELCSAQHTVYRYYNSCLLCGDTYTCDRDVETHSWDACK